jgi:hypothetical protein
MSFQRDVSRSSVFAARAWPVARDVLSELAASMRRRTGAWEELDEARELLAYWERRARRLPRWSVLKRREARRMARVWRERVADGERLLYGAGLVGAMSLYASERRMPTRVAHRGRQAAHVALWTGVTLAVAALVLVVTFMVAFAEAVMSLI